MGSVASTIMAEAVGSIRTVLAYALEGRMMEDFNAATEVYMKASFVPTLVTGLARAYSQGVIFICFGFVYWIGSKWIIDGGVKGSSDTFFYGDMTPFERLLLPIVCMFMLAASFGQAAQGATDLTEAANAAKSLFELLDRVPPLTSSLVWSGSRSRRTPARA